VFDFNYIYTCLGNQTSLSRGLKKGKGKKKKRHGDKETEKGETKVSRINEIKSF